MMKNEYLPFRAEIREIVRHTEIERTFRLAYDGKAKPGQFFEVSIPKFGEAPISVSGVGDGLIDLTIRRVGRVTNEVFERCSGNSLYLRGPYGNGFDLDCFRGSELVVIAGGTGVSPARGVVDYFAAHTGEARHLTLIAGFKSPEDILFRADFERWSKTVNVILTTDSNGGDPRYQEGLVTVYIPKLSLEDAANAAAIVVGPPAMMRFSTRGLLDIGFNENHIWISHERRMCCGTGKCGHCRINDKYVCVDGPVFNLSTAKRLMD